jgi:hypothetical protein
LMNCACDFMGFNGIATDAHSPMSTHIAMWHSVRNTCAHWRPEWRRGRRGGPRAYVFQPAHTPRTHRP